MLIQEAASGRSNGTAQSEMMAGIRTSSRLWAMLLMGVVLVHCPGCPPPPKFEPITDDVPMDAVIARVNRNVAAMDFLLKASPMTATGKVRDPSTGRLEPFDTNGTLYFHKPRNLFAKLSHPLGGSVELGSNDEEFWYWEKVNRRRYYYGLYAEEYSGDVDEIALRPDYLVEILGLNELPVDTTGAEGPLFEVRPEHYVLSFIDSDENDQCYYTKSLFISRRSPFLVQSLVYYEPDGRPMIRVTLDKYETIEGASVRAPRQILIERLRSGSWVRIEFGRMQRSDNVKVEQAYIVRSPLQRGEVEHEQSHRLTHRRPPSSMPEVPPSSQPDPE